MMRMILEVVMVLALVLGIVYVMNEMKKENKADKALRDNEDKEGE
jgi:hypothetical protein